MLYTTMCKTKCPKCLQKNISLAHRAEDLKGHEPKDILEAIAQDAMKKLDQRPRRDQQQNQYQNQAKNA